MNRFKKACALICAITMLIVGLNYQPNVMADTYGSLTYTVFPGQSDIAYSIVSNDIAGWANMELLDSGATLQCVFSADNKVEDTKVYINDTQTAQGSGTVTLITTGLVKLNPMQMDDNAYTKVTIEATTGSAVIVIRRGTPSSEEGGTTVGPTSGSDDETATTIVTGETDVPAQTTSVTATTTTAGQIDASAPKQTQGVVAKTEVGEATINNSMMIAWADSTDPNLGDWTDTSVTSYNVYIYRNSQLVTKIYNATNGGVVGGLSAGNYEVQVAGVNSKGEGQKSNITSDSQCTVTGSTIEFTYPEECTGPKAPIGLSIITGNSEVPADNPAQAENTIGVAWAASNEPTAPSYDTSVTGYNLYLFQINDGVATPYRKVSVDGIATTTTITKSVSAGTYLVYLTSVSDTGESAFSAPGVNLASTVTVKGEVIDNAQPFETPKQPVVTESMVINEIEGNGFAIAWDKTQADSNIVYNLFVDGVCVKANIPSSEGTYHEMRLSSGTYKVEIKAQYVDTKVESFGISKTITITADSNLVTGVVNPSDIEDPSYSGYIPPETTQKPTTMPTETTVESGSKEDESTQNTTTKSEETSASPETTKPQVNPTTQSESNKPAVTTANKPSNATTKAPANNVKITVGKTKVTKATKKKSAKKLNVTLKKIKGATSYQVKISISKKFKNASTKTYKKNSFTIKKLKANKKYYVKARAIRKYNGVTYYGKWSSVKKVKLK